MRQKPYLCSGKVVYNRGKRKFLCKVQSAGEFHTVNEDRVLCEII